MPSSSSVLPDQKREGKVIKIIKRASRQVVGLFNKYDNFGFVTPDDKNFGSDIFISRKNFKKAKNIYIHKNHYKNDRVKKREFANNLK